MNKMEQLAVAVCGQNELAQLAFKQGFKIAREMIAERLYFEFDPRDDETLSQMVLNVGEDEAK